MPDAGAESQARGIAALREELALLDRLVNAHKVVHRRARYFQSVRMVRRHVHTALAVVAGGFGTALTCIERALRLVAAAWSQLRHLLAQSFFMPLALVLLALLARIARLLASMHAALRSSQRAGGANAAVVARDLPALLAPDRPSDSDDALARLFGQADGGEDTVCGGDGGDGHTFEGDGDCAALWHEGSHSGDEDLGESVADDLVELGGDPHAPVVRSVAQGGGTSCYPSGRRYARHGQAKRYADLLLRTSLARQYAASARKRRRRHWACISSA